MSGRRALYRLGVDSVLWFLPFAASAVEPPLEAWVARYREVERSQARFGPFEFAIAVDRDGSVVVSGTTIDPETVEDYTTVKYDPDGKEVWVRRFNGHDNGLVIPRDLTHGMALDGQGNIYVTGNSPGLEGGSEATTVKYDPDGNELWVRRHGPAGGYTRAFGIAVDPAGFAHIIDDLATVKYAPNGDVLWVLPNELVDNDFFPAVIRLDPSGNVYLGGHLSRFSIDFAVVKCDPDGNVLWVAAYDGTGRIPDEARALAVDPLGNVYVTGTSLSPTERPDYATVKYSPDGRELWVRRFKGAGWTNQVRALALDGSGNVIVTGYSGTDLGVELATIKYDAQGNELWVSRLGQASEPAALAVDGRGAIFIIGRPGALLDWDYTTVKLNADGGLAWVHYTGGPANGGDDALSIALGPDGGIHVTGWSLGEEGTFDIMTVKYLEDPVPGPRFIRGDSNGSGDVDLSDGVFTLGYMFLGQKAPECRRASDANDDGRLDIADPVYLLNYLFLAGPDLSTPGLRCGEDPTFDELSCESHPACE